MNAEKIKKRLRDYSITQAKLARASGISPGQLSGYLGGKNAISSERLSKIVNLLGGRIDVAWDGKVVLFIKWTANPKKELLQ